MNRRKLKTFALVGLLIVGSVAQTACGNATTLDRVGFIAMNVAQAVEDQVLALKASGVTGPKLEAWERAARGLKTTTKSLDDFLKGLKDVNAKDAAEIVAKIGQASAIIGGLLQNPDVLGLGEGALFVKILRYGSIALQQLSLSLGVFFPQPPAGVAAATASKSIPVGKIKIDFPEPPPDVKALINR